MNINGWDALRVALLKQHGRHCHWCGCRMTWLPKSRLPSGSNMTFEHLIERSKGGSNDIENLRLACFDCNNGREACPTVAAPRKWSCAPPQSVASVWSVLTHMK